MDQDVSHDRGQHPVERAQSGNDDTKASDASARRALQQTAVLVGLPVGTPPTPLVGQDVDEGQLTGLAQWVDGHQPDRVVERARSRRARGAGAAEPRRNRICSWARRSRSMMTSRHTTRE